MECRLDYEHVTVQSHCSPCRQCLLVALIRAAHWGRTSKPECKALENRPLSELRATRIVRDFSECSCDLLEFLTFTEPPTAVPAQPACRAAGAVRPLAKPKGGCKTIANSTISSSEKTSYAQSWLMHFSTTSVTPGKSAELKLLPREKKLSPSR